MQKKNVFLDYIYIYYKTKTRKQIKSLVEVDSSNKYIVIIDKHQKHLPDVNKIRHKKLKCAYQKQK